MHFFRIQYVFFQCSFMPYALINAHKPKRAYENIARIAKAALHKLRGKSNLNVDFVCPVCPPASFKIGYQQWTAGNAEMQDLNT